MDTIFAVISSEKIVTVILTGYIIYLKLYTNNKLTPIQMKELVVSIPGEIEILSIGFVISDIYSDESIDYAFIGLLTLLLFAFSNQLKTERNIHDQLIGDWDWVLLAKVVGLYLLGLSLFALVLIRGGMD